MIQVSFRGAGYQGTDQRSAHFHADYEMLYVNRGWCEVRVGLRSYRCDAPCAVFFGNLETHRIVAASEDYERYVLTVSPGQLRDMSAKLLSVFRSRPSDCSHVLSLKEDDDTVDVLFSAIEKECAQADEYGQMCAASLVLLLLTHLYRLAPDAFPAQRRAYPSGIIHAQQYLDERFREPVSIDEVARRFYMSPGYFRHLFQELIGLSPKQYVVLNRLAYARMLLEDSRLSVAEIAEQSGFSDVSNFIRRFKAHFGVTPHQMRINDRL